MPRRGDPINLMTAYAKTLSNDGIIAQLWDYLQSKALLDDAPYLGDRAMAQVIDNYYYYAWSGDKLVAPLIMKLWDYENDLLPVERMQQIAEMFWAVNKDNLSRMWGMFLAEYDPVNNYHIKEHTDYLHGANSGWTDRGTETLTKSGSESHSRDGGHTVETTGASVSSNDVWGFDSAAAVADSRTETIVGEDKSGTPKPWKEEFKYNNGGESTTVSYTNRQDTKSFTGRGRDASENADDDLDILKDGNLGVMPTAQILQAEVDFWAWNFYKNVLFKALDATLTLPLY